MDEFNIIGDIHGRFDLLQRLLKKMPKGIKTLSVGDLIDRGTQSKEVLDYFIDGGHEAIMGNHEHMMLDWLDLLQSRGPVYPDSVWRRNGGTSTICSLMGWPQDRQFRSPDVNFDEKYINWLKNLPLTKTLESHEHRALVTHAPFSGQDNLNPIHEGRLNELSIVWNRQFFRPDMEGVDTYICGHLSLENFEKITSENGAVLYCIDTFGKTPDTLTGMHWPSMNLFQAE